MDQSPRVASPGCQKAGRFDRDVVLRGRHADRAVQTWRYERVREGRNGSRCRRLPGERRIPPGEWARPDLCRRTQDVSRWDGDGRAVRADAGDSEKERVVISEGLARGYSVIPTLPAGIRPAFATREGIECRRRLIEDRPLTSPQDDREIIERGRRALQGVVHVNRVTVDACE